MSVKYFLLSFTCLFFLSLGGEVHAAPTYFEGTIMEDSVWTASSSPYVLTGKVTIPQGVTLTIEPGVQIKLWQQGIVVNGSIVVEGTETDPVKITSQKDDTVGGDSNKDGSNSLPMPGDWQGIQFNVGASGIFNSAIIKYSGYTYSSSISKISVIHNLSATIEVSNSEFSHSSTCAIGQTGGSLVFKDSTVHDQSCAVVALGGKVHIERNTVKNNNFGVFINGATEVELTDNTFENNTVVADVTLTGLHTFIHSGNVSTGATSIGNGLLIRGVVEDDMELTQDSLPYLITSGGGSSGMGGLRLVKENNLTVSPTGSLTLSQAVVVKFHDSGELQVNGTLTAQGTGQSPVTFTSIKDDTVGGDTNGDNVASEPLPGDWLHIEFGVGSTGVFNHSIIRYAGHQYPSFVRGSSRSNIFNAGGLVTLTSSEVAYALTYGIRHDQGTTTVTQSNIHDNDVGLFNDTQKLIDARNNYWGDPSGPYNPLQNSMGLGDSVSNNVLFDPWKNVFCVEECYSSVLFLPGMQGSRLYKNGLLGTKDRIWEPHGNQDVQQLEMNESGESVNDVYTSDIVSKAYGFVDIYDNFARFMTNLVADGVIRDWTPFAYDWRQSVVDLAENGMQYENEMLDVMAEIEYLARNSLSGKVTIVGHSNGGLLAKAIMLRLEEEGKTDLVDKVVFLASPQLGTPAAIGAILHGFDQQQGFGLLIDDKVARDIIVNMPGAYGLLPSQRYFNVAPGLVTFFDNSASTEAFRVAYGNAISSETELIEFMSGYGDQRPQAETTADALRANRNFLEVELAQHRQTLDNWVAPEEVEVIEVVGVGLDTAAGFYYTEFTERVCGLNILGFISCDVETFYKPKPYISQYGDKTVMAQSAEGYDGVKQTYYLDLLKIKQNGETIEHANFTEHISVQKLLQNIITELPSTDIPFVSKTQTTFDKNSVMLGTHSPVNIEAIDSEGRKVGVEYVGTEYIPHEVEDVPGSSYLEIGGSKYVVLPTEFNYFIKIKGTGEGGLTFTLDTLDGEIQTPVFSVAVATITASTTINLSYNDGTLSNLFIDTNSDGVVDIELTPEGEQVLSEVSYYLLRKKVEGLPLSNQWKKPLLALVTRAEAFNKSSGNIQIATLESSTLNRLKEDLEKYVERRLLTNAQVEPISKIIMGLQ